MALQKNSSPETRCGHSGFVHTSQGRRGPRPRRPALQMRGCPSPRPGPGGAAAGCRAGGRHPAPLQPCPPRAAPASSPSPPLTWSLAVSTGVQGRSPRRRSARAPVVPRAWTVVLRGLLPAAGPGEPLRARGGRLAGGLLCLVPHPALTQPQDPGPAGQQATVLRAEPGGRHGLGGLQHVCGLASAQGTWVG